MDSNKILLNYNAKFLEIFQKKKPIQRQIQLHIKHFIKIKNCDN